MAKRAPSRIGGVIAARFSVLAPDWLCALFFGQPVAKRITVVQGQAGRGQITHALLTSTSPTDRKFRIQRTVDLVVPRALFLERSIQAPRSARSKLDTLAALDLRHRTPFGPDDVYARLGAVRTEGDRLLVPQWVIKRSDVEDWRRNLTANRMRLRRLYIEAHPQPIADFSAQIAPGGSKLRWINGSLVAGTAAALLAGWLYPGWVAQHQTRSLDSDLDALREEALDLRQEVEALRSRDSERANFLEALLRRAALVDTIRELTVALPDSVWVETTTFTPSLVKINGQIKGSAADLVLALGQRQIFANPRLSGSVSKTPDNAERFEITVDLEGS